MKEKYLADKDLGTIGGDKGFGPWGNLDLSNIRDAANAFSQIISNVIGVLTIVGGIWFIFVFVTGAFQYLTAGGEPEAIKKASKRITTGIIGLVIIVTSYALISLLGNLLGFNILQPQLLIKELRP